MPWKDAKDYYREDTAGMEESVMLERWCVCSPGMRWEGCGGNGGERGRYGEGDDAMGLEWKRVCVSSWRTGYERCALEGMRGREREGRNVLAVYISVL